MFQPTYTPADFDQLANQLLNSTVLVANNTRYRLCEIEMYLRNDAHPDEYVHKNKDQQTHSQFYFHKYHNGTYKSGTYKGVDIALGNTNTSTYFGVLIRSIQQLDTGEFTEGSCNCVNRMLKQFEVATVSELMDKHFGGLKQIETSNQTFGLVRAELPRMEMYKGPRIGLSTKYPEYQHKQYRYAIQIASIKKQRKTFVKVGS
jgi:hypothetical protein